MEIQGYPNYLIYPDGRVWSKPRHRVKGKYLPARDNGRGYLRVKLSNDGIVKNIRVHRLVASHYIPNPENKPEINHIDGDKTNNSIENLEWVTRIENLNRFKKVHKNNKLGIKNISRQGKGFVYSKTNYGENHKKYFETLEEAIEYKITLS